MVETEFGLVPRVGVPMALPDAVPTAQAVM
jgi:hypothetical protein